jgi:hypothetical protein
MVTTHLIPPDLAAQYEIHEWRNAAGVLATAHPAEWHDTIDALRAFEFRRSEGMAVMGTSGGRKPLVASCMAAAARGRSA